MTEILTRSNQVVAVIDSGMIVRWVSPSALSYGLDPIGLSIVDLIHPPDLERVAPAFDPMVFEEEFEPSHMANSIMSLRLVGPTRLVPFEASGLWVRDPSGESWLVVVLNDITTRYGASSALRKLAAGADPVEAAEAIIDAAHAFGGVNGVQLVHHAGREHRTLGDLGTDPAAVAKLWPEVTKVDVPTEIPPPSGSDWGFALPLAAADELLGAMVVWGQGNAPGIQFVNSVMEPLLDLAALSVTRSRELAELNRQATTDHGTGLLNRHAFFASLDRPISDAAVVYVDLDAFKAVNDQFGHTLGDQLLAEISRRLRAVADFRDPVGRLGGDEFAVMCVGVSEQTAHEVGDRVANALNQIITIDAQEIAVGASVGVAYSKGPIDGRDLLDAADQALLRAKSDGKGRVVRLDLSI